jgi:GDP-L-fucose synthase
MIPAIIKKIANAVKNGEETVEIWGTGKVRREFLLASDLAKFIWYCVENFEKMPKVVNCSSGKDLTIDEFYEKIAKVLGYKGKFTHNTKYPDGIFQKLTDNTKMKNFGWKPVTSFEDGVREAFEFYRNNSGK